MGAGEDHACLSFRCGVLLRALTLSGVLLIVCLAGLTGCALLPVPTQLTSTPHGSLRDLHNIPRCAVWPEASATFSYAAQVSASKTSAWLPSPLSTHPKVSLSMQS